MSKINYILKDINEMNIGLGISTGSSINLTSSIDEYTGNDNDDFESIIRLSADNLVKLFYGNPKECLQGLDKLINNPRFKTLITDNTNNLKDEKSFKNFKNDLITIIKKHVAHPFED